MPEDDVGSYDNEPTLATKLTVELLTDDGWQSHPARIADLTRQELWVELDRRLATPLDPGRSVRLVLRHPRRPTQVAETLVLWHIGRTGNVVVLKRPRLWDPPSRREHARVDLAVPVYLRADDGSGPVPTTSTNIGVGGLYCVAAMELRIGQRVDVTVQLTPAQIFDCQAEVARLDDDPNDPLGLQLLVGLHFLDLGPRDRMSLAKALLRLARDADANRVPRPWYYEEVDLLVRVDIDGELAEENGAEEPGEGQTVASDDDDEADVDTIAIELDETA